MHCVICKSKDERLSDLEHLIDHAMTAIEKCFSKIEALEEKINIHINESKGYINEN